MQAPSKPANESARLEALRAYRLLDTQSEQPFDDIVKEVARLLNMPIALVSLVDDERQWFKAKVGIDACETSRDVSFCGHAILSPGVMVVKDATKDPRFADNPLVTGPPHIRFYAGAPLVDAYGMLLGTLCVVDTKPRGLSPKEELLLINKAGEVIEQVRRRDSAKEAERFIQQLMHKERRQRNINNRAC